jgi:hypothetical protein
MQGLIVPPVATKRPHGVRFTEQEAIAVAALLVWAAYGSHANTI